MVQIMHYVYCADLTLVVQLSNSPDSIVSTLHGFYSLNFLGSIVQTLQVLQSPPVLYLQLPGYIVLTLRVIQYQLSGLYSINSPGSIVSTLLVLQSQLSEFNSLNSPGSIVLTLRVLQSQLSWFYRLNSPGSIDSLGCIFTLWGLMS